MRRAPATRQPPAQTPPAPSEPTLSPDQTIAILHKHVEICRRAFYRLAQVRGADRVRNEGMTLADAQAYADAEIRGLDQQLAEATPTPAGNS